MNLASTFLRLKADSSVEPLPVDDTFWRRLSSGELGSFQGERLVSIHAAEGEWPHWEMHPHGDEVICLLSGQATFVLEEVQGKREIPLTEPHAVALVPRGIWHTARCARGTTLLFITPGEGTRHRERSR